MQYDEINIQILNITLVQTGIAQQWDGVTLNSVDIHRP